GSAQPRTAEAGAARAGPGSRASLPCCAAPRERPGVAPIERRALCPWCYDPLSPSRIVMSARSFAWGRQFAAALALAAVIVPEVALAAGETPACTAELAAMDRSFAQGLVRVLTAGSPAEQCAALADQ